MLGQGHGVLLELCRLARLLCRVYDLFDVLFVEVLCLVSEVLGRCGQIHICLAPISNLATL